MCCVLLKISHKEQQTGVCNFDETAVEISLPPHFHGCAQSQAHSLLHNQRTVCVPLVVIRIMLMLCIHSHKIKLTLPLQSKQKLKLV